MLRRCISLAIVALVWAGSVAGASAAHELPYEFRGTHFAFSVERFMGIDYIDVEGPGGGDTTARLLLDGGDGPPTTRARVGFDVFVERLSIGVAGGVTTDDTAIIEPRVGYLFGITPTIGFWLRAGGFYEATPGPNYFGITAEALFAWFPYPIFSIHFGPTLDVAFAEDPNPNYLQIGLPEVGVTAFF
jgi:hypothetical protein